MVSAEQDVPSSQLLATVSRGCCIRITGDTNDGRLLGAQLVGTRGAEISKRVDTYATSLHHGMTVAAMSDLDLSYTPPLGSPWDAVQVATQAWERATRPSVLAV